MRWTRGGRSANVEDRRGSRVARGGSLGIGILLVLVALSIIFRQDFVSLLGPELATENATGRPSDVDEGLRAAAAIGDDRIQSMTQGYVAPESFTHGSSAQRVEWLRRGLDQGDPERCDTFSNPY